jgi:hypothetical protein
MRPYRDRQLEPDAERRYIDATIAGDFALARALFEHIPEPEGMFPIPRAAAPGGGPVVVVRFRAGKLDRALQWLGAFEAAGAWLVELDGRAVLCGFDEWVVIDGSATPEERRILHDLGVLRR